MLEFFGLLLKLFYLSIAMIIYALFNLFVSAGSYYKKGTCQETTLFSLAQSVLLFQFQCYSVPILLR